MRIGDPVETTCSYSKAMHGAYLKGRIIDISETDKTVVEVEKSCGCKTWINTHWLQKRKCCCSWLRKRKCCSCYYHCNCCC